MNRWCTKLMLVCAGGLGLACADPTGGSEGTVADDGVPFGSSAEEGSHGDGPGPDSGGNDGTGPGTNTGPADGPGDGPGDDGPSDDTAGGDTSGQPGECGSPQVFEGQATYYELATPLVNCSFETPGLPAHYGALNTEQYATAAHCGACARVTGPNGTIDIQIVDQCPFDTNPICYGGHIDLNPPAFAAIGNKIDGIIPITWEFIPCEATGPIEYYFKEGSSEFWTAVQIRNHRYAIASVEYRASDGTWRDIPRTEFNYFIEEAGMGPPPYAFRVTDVHGGVVVDEGVPLEIETALGGSSQLPQCE